MKILILLFLVILFSCTSNNCNINSYTESTDNFLLKFYEENDSSYLQESLQLYNEFNCKELIKGSTALKTATIMMMSKEYSTVNNFLDSDREIVNYERNKLKNLANYYIYKESNISKANEYIDRSLIEIEAMLKKQPANYSLYYDYYSFFRYKEGVDNTIIAIEKNSSIPVDIIADLKETVLLLR